MAEQQRPRARSYSSRQTIALTIVMLLGLLYAPSASSGRRPNCGPQISTAADDAPNTALLGDGSNIDQLDLIATKVGAKDANTLLIDLMVKDLSADIPINGMSTNWMLKWTYGDTIYFARARIDRFSQGAVAYTFGTYNPEANTHSTTGETEGTFSAGPGGSIKIDIPFNLVANPEVGEKLTDLFAVTYLGQGVPGAGTLNEIDRGPKEPDAYGKDYVVGSCKAKK